MSQTPLPDAKIVPFYLVSGAENVAMIRGQVASVGKVATTILERHDYPLAIASLQAEALALAACLASTLKFDGVFTLQAKGDALVKTLFADMTSQGNLRGYAAFDTDAKMPVEDDVATNAPADVPALMGAGYIAFTVDQGATGGRYQGIVDLDGATLSDAATTWFANSEQLDTLVLAAAGKIDSGKIDSGKTGSGEWQATAMILQRIAADGGHNNAGDVALSDDAWHTAKTLIQSVRHDELVDPALGPEDLIFRLFNSMEPHVAPATDVRDQCRCSPQRVETMLKQLDPAEIAELGDSDGFIDITCEFCKTNRRIAVDEFGG